jgi:hypothetical protein
MGLRNATKFLLENLNRRDCLGDLDRDGRIILKWILSRVGLCELG